MIILELIQRVQALYSKGVASDDTRLSARHIYNKLLTVRSKLLSQKINKKQKINQWNYQTLPCVEVIKVDINECPCLPPVGCQILRTKYKLPRPLLSLSEHMIQSVSSIDGQIIYNETTWNAYKNKKGNKYTAYNPDYFIKNGYLYITHKEGPQIITIVGLFSDPIESLKYPSACEDCIDCMDCEEYYNKEFPIDDDLLDFLVESSVQELLNIFVQMKQDINNNSKDDNNTQPNE